MAENVLADIATEALKPVSGIIDALLKPKLQRIKNWAEKRDLKDQLGNIVVDIILEDYLRRSLRRICGITTIVFPQQILPLPSIYEPLYLSNKYGIPRNRKSRLDAKSLQPGRNYFIVDSAGMGKSTFAKHLVLQIIKFTQKIPIFFELRKISDAESILEKLSMEIDETKKDIDAKLLQMLLDEGNFVIILDGYDELPEQLRTTVGQQITELAIRSDKNSWVITARPEASLPEIPDSQIFTIKPLSETQAQSLLRRYDKVANIDVGERLIQQFSVVPKRFLETPLLVVLLYRTYGFNQSIATRITSFYDEVYNALYKGHDLSKAGFARPKSSQLDSEDFRRLLRGFAFLLAIRQQNNINSRTEGSIIVDEAAKLTSVRPTTSSSFFEDLLLAVPLLVRDGTDFRFIHKSIIEYFAAEFLAYQFTSEQIIERIRDSHLYQSFINSFEYLSEISPSLFRKLIVAPLATAILAEENPIRDMYIRSLCFWGKVSIGLWIYEKYTTKTNDTLSVSLPNEGEFNEIHYSYGDLNGTRYILAVAKSTGFRRLPSKAWELISQELREQTIDELTFSDMDFNGLDNALDNEQWIHITDERIINNANHPAIKTLLARMLAFGPIFRSEAKLRVIDEKACEDLLSLIEQEEETQNWLQTLLPK